MGVTGRRPQFLIDLAGYWLGWLVLSALISLILTVGFPSYSLGRFWSLATIVAGSESGALFLGRFPRGHDFVMLRLGGAAFCRTIVPLLLSLLFAWYSREPLGRADVLPLLAVYGYGLVLGNVLSVRHLQSDSPGVG